LGQGKAGRRIISQKPWCQFYNQIQMTNSQISPQNWVGAEMAKPALFVSTGFVVF
jgi:hypothetical protein